MTQDYNTKTVAPDDAVLDIDGSGLDGPGLADFLPDTSNGYIAKAGAALENPAGQADPVAVEDALKSVHDPEIPVNIYELGLIYEIDISDAFVVDIKMTLTAPGCPVAQSFPGESEGKVSSVSGVAEAHVELVWEPMWTKDMMSEAAQLQLGFF